MLCTDKERRDEPSVMELAGGLVEEDKVKGHDWSMKLTSGDKLVFLSFKSQKEFSTWITKCIKVCIYCISLFMLFILFSDFC